MRFTLEIDCDNAAFADNVQGELQWLLQDVLERVPCRPQTCDMVIHDSNGNYVGKFRLDA